MAEKIFNEQINCGWGHTFTMTRKAPVINKRIFDKLDDAQEFADNFDDSAVEGLLLSVVSDEDVKKNGVYFVKTIKTNESSEPAILNKLAFGDLEEAEASINSRLENLKTEHQNDIVAINDEIEKLINEHRADKADIDDYTVNNKRISGCPVLNSDDFKISDSYSYVSQEADNVSVGDKITTAISKLEVMLANTTLALTAAISDIESRVGRPAAYDASGALISQATGLYKKYLDLEEKLNNN